eukprot:4964256-Lingulodinium_polyedra.AAC.1
MGGTWQQRLNPRAPTMSPNCSEFFLTKEEKTFALRCNDHHTTPTEWGRRGNATYARQFDRKRGP